MIELMPRHTLDRIVIAVGGAFVGDRCGPEETEDKRRKDHDSEE